MAECPHCEYNKKRAQHWRVEAYRLAGHPLPEREQEPEPERESEVEKLKRCLFQMQEAAKDLVQQAQPKQEQGQPVAYFNPQVKGGFYWAKPTKITAPITVSVEPIPFYTTPQQRTWVGLTDKEAQETFAKHNCTISADLAGILARAIKAKLKEKNNG